MEGGGGHRRPASRESDRQLARGPRPRGEFALYEPLAAAPNASLWLDRVWACSRETGIEKLAESPRDEEARR